MSFGSLTDMKALLIETSTERALISLISNDQVLFDKELSFGLNQSRLLMTEIEDLSRLHPLNSETIDCVAIGIGPGSYTGLRVGVVVGKTLAYTWKCPLITFSSLESFIPNQLTEGPFAAVIDAKIGGLYLLEGSIKKDQIIYKSSPKLVSLEGLEEVLKDNRLLVSPSIHGLKKRLDQLFPENNWQWEEVSPNATHLAKIIWKKFQVKNWITNGRVDLLYLRKTQAEIEKEQ